MNKIKLRNHNKKINKILKILINNNKNKNFKINRKTNNKKINSN